MFDIGFSELIIIGVVALIVIGPERLPKVARTAGHLYGRMQRYVSSVKSDISQEIELEELRRTGQEFRQSVESTVTEVQQQATVVDDYLRDEAADIKRSVTSADETDAFPPLAEPPLAAPEKKPADASPMAQQSLPLDEPDQDAAAPAAVVETARTERPSNSA